MAVRVKDILHIKIMEKAVVLSGHNGLDKAVHRIASIERPFRDHPEYSYDVAKPGDLYISKLYVFDGSVEKLYEELEFQRETKACGLITHKEMTYFLDERVLELSNQYGLPIIVIDNDISLTELIFSITDLIIRDRTIQVHVKHFENLLQNDLSEEEVEKNILSLDWELKNKIQCIFLKTDKIISANAFEADSGEILLPIYNGLAYIFTDEKESAILKKKQNFIRRVKETQEQYFIGISDLNIGLKNVKRAVLESIYAYVFGRNLKRNIMEYDELGNFSLMIDLRNHKSLKRYKERFFDKMRDFDPEGKLDLERIIELFIISGGDFKRVADEMFIHETTVRYRLKKLKKHLNYGNPNDFYADIKETVYASWVLEDEILHLLR